MPNHYTAEEAGRLVANWATTKERLNKRLRGIDSAMDLDRGVKSLDPRLRRRIKKLVREGFEPGRIENNRYPDPNDLLKVVEALKEEGKNREAAIISRTIRDIRLLRSLAAQMTGRRKREPIQCKADRRLVGKCSRCPEWIERGTLIYWDRDKGLVWHEYHGLEQIGT